MTKTQNSMLLGSSKAGKTLARRQTLKSQSKLEVVSEQLGGIDESAGHESLNDRIEISMDYRT